jgi:hypothetical protein
MNCYFTEEHQSFREFKRFLVKEVVPHIEKWEKQVPLNVLYGKFGDMGFLEFLIQKHTVV